MQITQKEIRLPLWSTTPLGRVAPGLGHIARVKGSGPFGLGDLYLGEGGVHEKEQDVR